MANIVELSEKEMRVIKVALWKHFMNMVDDDGKASREDLQPFADCCYETYQRFCEMDNEKDFQQLSGSRTLKP